MSAIEPAIVTSSLSKRYSGSKVYALQGLSISVMPGEVYGFLGPNGAGKSTTIRLLMNFIQPTSGHASILGLDTVKSSARIKSSVGYLSGEVALYPKMTGRQFLKYMSDLQPPKRASYVTELSKRFGAVLNQRIGSLSKGNRQKIGIIQAFMHQPKVFILDEPTAGLDPLMQEVFFELALSAKADGASLFISSHNLGEVQKMCDRIGFIRRGKLISEQTIADLTASASQTFHIHFAQAAPMLELKHIPKAKVTLNSPRSVTVLLQGDMSPLFAVLARHKVRSLDRREVNLEEEFMRFYKDDKK